MKWTKEELYEHIKINVKDYSAAVVVAALYKKLYGEFPKIGLSGTQGEFADSMVDSLPDPQDNLPSEAEINAIIWNQIQVTLQDYGRWQHEDDAESVEDILAKGDVAEKASRSISKLIRGEK